MRTGWADVTASSSASRSSGWCLSKLIIKIKLYLQRLLSEITTHRAHRYCMEHVAHIDYVSQPGIHPPGNVPGSAVAPSGSRAMVHYVCGGWRGQDICYSFTSQTYRPWLFACNRRPCQIKANAQNREARQDMCYSFTSQTYRPWLFAHGAPITLFAPSTSRGHRLTAPASRAWGSC